MALALGGRTIAELKAAMSRVEFIEWCQFYKLFPFDDFHRYHRPSALVSVSIGGGDIDERLEWLQPDPRDKDMNDADMNTLRAMGYKHKPGKE